MDLRRWYPKDAGKMINDSQVGAFIEHRGEVIPDGWRNKAGSSIEKRYNETRGFWMIPPSQITLSEGVLVQSPGWTDEFDHDFDSNQMPYKDE